MSGCGTRALVGVRRRGGSSAKCLLNEAPEGWLDVYDVAALLGYERVRSVRVLLNRNAVERVFVKVGGAGGKFCPYKCFWKREEVMRLLESKPVMGSGIPAGWCGAYDACLMLDVSRSGLGRLVNRGRLDVRKVRLKTDAGIRVMVIYRVDQLRSLRVVLDGEQDEKRLRRRCNLRAPKWEGGVRK
jgi:hypothetical protein